MLKIFRLIKDRRYKQKNTLKSLKTNKNLDFKVKIVNDDTNDLAESLGILETKSKELLDICLTNYKKHNCFAETISKTSEEVNHQNELVFVALMLGKIHAKQSYSVSEMLQSLK